MQGQPSLASHTEVVGLGNTGDASGSALLWWTVTNVRPTGAAAILRRLNCGELSRLSLSLREHLKLARESLNFLIIPRPRSVPRDIDHQHPEA
jgi:hypothetical protein